MSFDYYVAIHKDQWPTSAAVQQALSSLGVPVMLAQSSDAPLAASDATLQVILEGRSVDLEAEIEQATDVDDPDSLYGALAQKAAPTFKISNGDWFLTLTFRSDADQIRAGLFIAAAMILSFDGYGFENQFETNGAEPFAAQLLREATAPEWLQDQQSEHTAAAPQRMVSFSLGAVTLRVLAWALGLGNRRKRL